MDADEPVENEDEFWEEIDDITSTPCRTFERIDDTLRTWISFIGTNTESYLKSEQDVLRCSFALWSSDLFEKNAEYIRRQIVFALLQEDDPVTLHLAAALLLLDGRKHDKTFELMSAEGVFPCLVQHIKNGFDDGLGLHRQLLELLYEMSRIQQISSHHLMTVDDDFILFLFRILEGLASDASDPYHYPVIRVLLVLNEQYLLASHSPTSPQSPTSPSAVLTNRVIKAISTHGTQHKTFGETLILVLNREAETSTQLLILKLLYLLFTTPSTAEYFYTNDLHVLVDIIMRNLLDLPPPPLAAPVSANGNGAPPDRTASLRHTYLRVLHPLVANTQLRNPPHYKRAELRRMLNILADAGGAGNRHFERPDDTTVRLVGRCIAVDWLKDTNEEAHNGEIEAANEARDEVEEHDSRGRGHKVVAQKTLGVAPPEASQSSVSMEELAEARERPGVMAPSRRSDAEEARVAEAETAGTEVEDPFDD